MQAEVMLGLRGHALEIVRMAREMHRGNGIQIGYHGVRRAQNPATVKTQEGDRGVTPDSRQCASQPIG